MMKNKIILLTGAGFSSIVGLKTQKSVIESIQLPIDLNNETQTIIFETFRIIKGQKGVDNATLEDLLAKLIQYIKVSEMILNDSIFREKLQVNNYQIYNGHFKSIWEEALSYCYRLMLDNYGPQRIDPESKEFRFIINALNQLCKKNNDCLHVFTTNYDSLLNVLAEKCVEINFYSNINNSDGKFGKEYYIINKKNYNKKNPSVYIHRLHGCIGWFSDASSPFGVHEVYGIGNKLEIEDPRKLNQMAIKLVSDEKIGLKPAFSHAFEQFHDKLNNCENLLVWGHSFKDLEVIKSIISTSTNKRKGTYKIYYIDPFKEIPAIKNNIDFTIRGETGIKNNLDLIRIDWEKGDGYSDLLLKLDRII